MKLWLLRHGEAAAQARSDAERALTAHGRAEVRQSAERLRGAALQQILVSPYLRAQQTAELVREVLGLDLPLTTLEWLTPDDSPREVANQLDHFVVDELLIVSHNPLLGALAGLLVHGHLQLPFPLRTASLVGLEAELPLIGGMRQIGLYHPG
ncbi:phosphohistidine phosphatase SixA [Aquipseudomonas ullengensis]|uniref:Phosphohistidine phosphatase SixA n=1 Tax=Aquipseudomonas ullengensis TaxID=2759166 RepID=A0A7W4LN71_9GAMM|nr:phosphohistidine phosphatase SixA [Pseudomonas ullengensis]MBB2496255.1 phosphohistidine phosphatase SixA [Pseudomonas ullengensis]